MNDRRNRLLAWRPGDPGLSHDDVILAVGLQCQEKKFAVGAAISWMGIPDKSIGDSQAGHLAYYFHDDDTNFAEFDVSDGRVISFGTLVKGANNAHKVDEETGDKIPFNMLDVMEPFNEASFK